MFGTKQMRFKNRMESYNSVIRQDGRYHKSNDCVRLLGFADLQTPSNLQDAPHYLPVRPARFHRTCHIDRMGDISL